MTRSQAKDGFALVYAMLSAVVMISVFTAFLWAYQGTFRANRFSEDSVKAKALADTGNEFVYQLFLKHGTNFIDLGDIPFEFSNDPASPVYLNHVTDPSERSALGARLSASELGGTFTVRVADARPAGVSLPSSGTFWTMLCRAKVNDYQTTDLQASRFLIKLGTPFVNYLKIGKGRVIINPGNRWNGPLFATDDPDTGQAASLDFRSSLTKENDVTGVVQTTPYVYPVEGIIESGGEIRLMRQISLLSGSSLNEERSLQTGSYPAGTNLFEPTQPGGLSATGQLEVRANSTLTIKQDGMDDTLSSLRDFATANPALVQTLDIGDASIDSSLGILVEVDGATLKVYEASRESVGKLYDIAALRSIYDPKPAGLIDRDPNRLDFAYGSRAASISAGVRECEWDDPVFPEEPYPPGLLTEVQAFLATEGVTLTLPSSGDYFEVSQVVPGTELATYTLSDGAWTTLRLVARTPRSSSHDIGDLSSPSPQVYPPVFVRGQVDGKLFLTYDDEDTSPVSDGCSIYVLGDARGSIAGGLRLQDPSDILLDSTAAASTEGDMVLLMADDEVRSYSLPASLLQRLWVDDASGGSWQDLLAATLSNPSVTTDQMDERSPAPHCWLQAATVGAVEVDTSRALTTDLRRIVNPADDMRLGNYLFNAADAHRRWEGIRSNPLLPPVHSSLTGLAIVPRRMRLAFASPKPSYDLIGARCSLGDDGLSASGGNFRYDYRWRCLDASDLNKVLGLPVSPILLDRRGF